MRTIWKYQLRRPSTVISLPRGATPLCVQLQDDEPHLWIMCDPDEQEREMRTFTIVGTGWRFRWPVVYIGTYQEDGYVWHLLETTNYNIDS